MTQSLVEEEWRILPEFSNYQVSNLGNVYNLRFDHPMRISFTTTGHSKITLWSEWDGKRYTRSVAQLVAEAFVDAPNEICRHVIVLDGDFTNLCADNLAWRPERFAWLYTRQMKKPQPLHYRNLEVHNYTTDTYYNSIMDAGVTEGLLFADIWRSTYTGETTFPYGYQFEVIERV